MLYLVSTTRDKNQPKTMVQACLPCWLRQWLFVSPAVLGRGSTPPYAVARQMVIVGKTDKKGPEKTILVNKRPVARDFAIFARLLLNHWRTTRYAKRLVCVPTKKVLWHCQSSFFRDHLSGFMLSSQLFHQVISVRWHEETTEMTTPPVLFPLPRLVFVYS